MKISELNTKSFLSGTGAAANSYVLINYEDNSTSEPVTYKASLQELGKAIANDLKLPSVTVSGNTIIDFKVKGVSNGAYTEKAVGVLSNDGPSMGDVNTAISGLASTGYVTDAVDGLASTGYVASAISDLGNDIMNYSTTEIGMDLYRIYTQYTDNAVYGLASTGYVTDAISGLASTGDVADAITDALDNIPGGTGTINLTDSYPFANDRGVLPASFTESSPHSLVVFAPFASDMIGPPYIQLPGEDAATPINLAGPYVINTGDGEKVGCSNLFLTQGDMCIFDTSSMAPSPIDPACLGNIISKAQITDQSYNLHPLFIDTNNNTLYYFDNENDNWQTISL